MTPSKLGDSGWQTLSLINGWTVGGTETPQYRKIGNVIYFRGAIVKNTGATEVCAVLPVGFRPNQQVRFPVTSNTTIILVGIINTDGEISMLASNSTGSFRTLLGASGMLVD